MIRVLIIGGYGNFGGTIARRLAINPAIQLLIGGRSTEKAQNFCHALKSSNSPIPVFIDITQDIAPILKNAKPDLVIHTSGPFQGQGYDVAKACIACGIHYCDLADGRDFVANIGQLDGAAKEKGVAVIVGASSVPTLTSAIMDTLIARGLQVEEIDYGIATAQQTRLGLATTAATLSYAGKPIKTLVNGKTETVYGWQNLHTERYPDLGVRLMANTDIPDLEIFSSFYPSLKTQRFYAGIEVKALQMGLWLLSWLVRWRILASLSPFSKLLAKSAGIFDFLGTDSSGFHFHAAGTDNQGTKFRKSFYLIAKHGDGPNIPCIPCCLIAEDLAIGIAPKSGAYPAIGIIGLERYLNAFDGLSITPIWIG